jgi:hypothetical protein
MVFGFNLSVLCGALIKKFDAVFLFILPPASLEAQRSQS